jgi:hypothetical protein
MPQNPLQQYFRQPKIFVKLPSQGVYNQPGAITGDVNNMPVFGMTGMDEILMRTPDALLSGESSVKIVQSCCPGIKDAWDMSILDSDMMFTAIRIATYGNLIDVTHKCEHCSAENDYELDITKFIEHFSKCVYDNKLVLTDLVIHTRPLTYSQSNDMNLKNFQLRQKLSQVEGITDDEQRKRVFEEIAIELGSIQNEIVLMTIESVEVGKTNVTERSYIAEWLINCDRDIFSKIKDHIDTNKDKWTLPTFPVECAECHQATNLNISMDQSNFFVRA